MKTITLTEPHTLLKKDLPKTVAAIGFFDGIHQGHQKVINTATKIAKENQMESAVITFHPHPSVVLSKGKKEVKYITPIQQKEDILQKMGVDRLYIIKFNEALASLSPQRFIDDYIIGLNVNHLVAGFDFTYGNKGKGNMDVIANQTRDEFSYSIVDKVQMNEEKVSSTKIRELLNDGKVAKAHNLLSRPFSTIGKVIEGNKRGRELGFPTANMYVEEDVLLPKPGIYAVRVFYKGEQYEGMASLGTNPTFSENRKLSLEVYILNYDSNLYGEYLWIDWVRFIRGEEKYSSVEELIKQMEQDEKETKAILNQTK